MTRTQIQLPDDLYREAKALCEEREMSLAELSRRGIEHMIRTLKAGKRGAPWSPPEPKALGWSGHTDEELKEIAQERGEEVDDRN